MSTNVLFSNISDQMTYFITVIGSFFNFNWSLNDALVNLVGQVMFKLYPTLIRHLPITEN